MRNSCLYHPSVINWREVAKRYCIGLTSNHLIMSLIVYNDIYIIRVAVDLTFHDVTLASAPKKEKLLKGFIPNLTNFLKPGGLR